MHLQVLTRQQKDFQVPSWKMMRPSRPTWSHRRHQQEQPTNVSPHCDEINNIRKILSILMVGVMLQRRYLAWTPRFKYTGCSRRRDGASPLPSLHMLAKGKAMLNHASPCSILYLQHTSEGSPPCRSSHPIAGIDSTGFYSCCFTRLTIHRYIKTKMSRSISLPITDYPNLSSASPPLYSSSNYLNNY